MAPPLKTVIVRSRCFMDFWRKKQKHSNNSTYSVYIIYVSLIHCCATTTLIFFWLIFGLRFQTESIEDGFYFFPTMCWAQLWWPILFQTVIVWRFHPTYEVELEWYDWTPLALKLKRTHLGYLCMFEVLTVWSLDSKT